MIGSVSAHNATQSVCNLRARGTVAGTNLTAIVHKPPRTMHRREIRSVFCVVMRLWRGMRQGQMHEASTAQRQTFVRHGRKSVLLREGDIPTQTAHRNGMDGNVTTASISAAAERRQILVTTPPLPPHTNPDSISQVR